jgi:hypothetical protein
MTARSGWYVLPMVAALASTPVRHADAQLLSFGLMAGGSLSTFTGDFAADVKNNAGFIAGGFVRVGALGFAVQPGLYYTSKGAKSSDFSETTGQGSRTKLDYIQIPLVLRLSLGPLYVGAGPAIGVKISCHNEPAGGESADCDDAFGPKSTEVSGIAEAGLQFGKFSLGARADIGISNAIEAIQSGNTDNVSYKTRTISAVAAIRF